MTVEIWMGGMTHPAYIIKAKKIESSIDGNFVKITDLDGFEIETNPSNIVIIHGR